MKPTARSVESLKTPKTTRHPQALNRDTLLPQLLTNSGVSVGKAIRAANILKAKSSLLKYPRDAKDQIVIEAVKLKHGALDSTLVEEMSDIDHNIRSRQIGESTVDHQQQITNRSASLANLKIRDHQDNVSKRIVSNQVGSCVTVARDNCR